MNTLQITQIKPNPIGKDRFGHLTPKTQLAGEWVDIKNITQQDISLSNTVLYHIAYTLLKPNGVWERAFSIDWVLPAGCTLRVHSGHSMPVAQMHTVDQLGADYHAFTGKDYIWNNNKSDRPRLVNVLSGNTVDEATYRAYPQEGIILKRSGAYLV